MKVLHLMSTGDVGGIEVLCKEIALNSPWENVFCFMFSGGAIADIIENKGIVTYRFYNYNRIWRLKLLIDLCKKKQFDIIIEHHEGISIELYYILLSKYVNNSIYIRGLHSAFDTLYGTEKSIFKKFLMGKILESTIKCSQKIFAVSEYVAKSFREQYPNASIVCIYNGISEKLIKKGFGNKNKAINNCIELLYVGRITKMKGVHLLISAMSKISKQFNNIRLRIVGDGAYINECRALVHNLKLTNYVLFEGQQTDITRYLESSNLFICPSICQEAFGITIIEAMSFGLICLATPVGGIPEIIKDSQNGFLTEGSAEADIEKGLLNTIGYYLDKKDSLLEEEAKKTAARFSIDRTVENLEHLFK